MKQYLIIIILVLSASTIFSQEEKYYSTEESDYYKRIKHKRFRPFSKRQAKSQTFDYIKIRQDTSRNNMYSGIYDYYKPNSKPIESIIGKHNGTTYQVYVTPSLNSGNWGCWLEIENEKEKKSYYLGFTMDYFIHIKAKQTIPLVKNDSIIQVQSAIVRQTKPEILPIGGPEFKLVKDYLIIEINLNQIIKDSDNDGLTDIVEERFLMNTKSEDTDGDGLNDSFDSNPRFKSWDTEKSKLYSYLLKHRPMDSVIVDTNMIFKDVNFHKYKNPTLIVTDEESLQHVKPLNVNDYYIIMSKSEYDKCKKKYPVDINRLYVSPLFKVDNVGNCYKIHLSGGFWGNDYVIYKSNGKWIIKNIGGYII